MRASSYTIRVCGIEDDAYTRSRRGLNTVAVYYRVRTRSGTRISQLCTHTNRAWQVLGRVRTPMFLSLKPGRDDFVPFLFAFPRMEVARDYLSFGPWFGSIFCCFWFLNATIYICLGKGGRVGLVVTSDRRPSLLCIFSAHRGSVGMLANTTGRFTSPAAYLPVAVHIFFYFYLLRMCELRLY